MSDWRIVATTEVPQDGRVAPESVVGAWTLSLDDSSGHFTGRKHDAFAVLEWAGGLPLDDVVHLTVTRTA